MRVRLRVLAVILILMASGWRASTVAYAGQVAAGGFSFSDELGGFRLIGVTGEGTSVRPFVIVEEITSFHRAVLVIRRQSDAASVDGWLKGAERQHIYVEKRVLNLSNKVWTGFDLELRQDLDRPSIYGDGLSFDQVMRREKDVTSDRFAGHYRLFEPRDLVQFDDGFVDPGHRLRINVPISDPTPVAKFYLLQQPRFLYACDPARCGSTTGVMRATMSASINQIASANQ